MSGLSRDLRYAFRQLLRNPGFALAAVACLALGIGANSSTFTFANALLLKRNPQVKEPERLVRLFIHWSSGLRLGSFSYPDYLDFRNRNEVFTGLVAERLLPVHLSAGDRNEKIWGSIVSANYFSELGVEASLGRGFRPEEDQTPGAHPVVVLSHGLWERRFAAAPGVIGQTVVLNRRPFTIVGVAPQGFTGTNTGIASEIWAPITMAGQLNPDSDLNARGDHWIGFVIGRLKPGVGLAQARESLNALMANLTKEYPDTNTGKSVDVYAEAEASLHPMVRSGFAGFLRVMFAVVGLILVLACANVAGLLLARALGRRREIAIRMALGAARGRLIRQLLVESSLLSLLGGAAGLLLAVWLTRLIVSFQPTTDLPLWIDTSIDLRVLGFTFFAAVAAGILFGLAPALQTTRQGLVPSLKEGSPQGGRSTRLRNVLVVGQVALSAGLLVAAGLAVRSLQKAQSIDPGFNPDNQLVAALDLDLQGYDEAAGREFQRRLRERMSSLPGVAAVGLARDVPLQLSSSQRGTVPEGYVTPPGAANPSIDYNVVDYGYFEAMGVAILRGRAFSERDDEKAPPVLIVNEAFAKRFWPDQDPIGRRVRTAGKNHEVVGVAKDGKYFSLGEDPKAYMYFPLAQDYHASTVMHLRSAGDPEALLGAVRREIRGLDPLLPIADLKTMHAALGFALIPARMAAGVVSAFAGIALLLAAVGLYGVIAYSVTQATRDIGIRVALGASSRDVLRMVLGGGMRLALTGLAIGLAAGVALARLMQGILYGVSASDPFSYASASLVLITAALLASFFPARRATRVDPMVALRAE